MARLGRKLTLAPEIRKVCQSEYEVAPEAAMKRQWVSYAETAGAERRCRVERRKCLNAGYK